ncbi:ankyrin repeat domain-containing protein [Falsigemmobacter intermedius]|uniref:Ankyrin repeat domain-containing protein n=1 Tax=Falsigemmobacter intermedius TaxID=1553448 RepID=A0A444M947_9RHOB|nr:ankyrin repeat domain-containing protein [Falsigemmobacter intermedius]RWY39191.1 ankyrin repeat domain-containing protein [Falsigemmobacter intermedius]
MHSEAEIETFAERLRTADEQGVRDCLQRDPGLAVAKLPSGWPVFLEQSVFPQPSIIDLMIAAGADPDAGSPEGETLLHLTGDPEAIGKLLSHGADINALDSRGYTPMMGHAPCPETGPDAIYTLFAAGADPYVQGADGRTVFDLLPEGERFDRLRRHLREKGRNR